MPIANGSEAQWSRPRISAVELAMWILAQVSRPFSYFPDARQLDGRENETCDGEEEQDQRDDETRDNHASHFVGEAGGGTGSKSAGEDSGSKPNQRNGEGHDELRGNHTQNSKNIIGGAEFCFTLRLKFLMAFILRAFPPSLTANVFVRWILNQFLVPFGICMPLWLLHFTTLFQCKRQWRKRAMLPSRNSHSRNRRKILGRKFFLYIRDEAENGSIQTTSEPQHSAGRSPGACSEKSREGCLALNNGLKYLKVRSIPEVYSLTLFSLLACYLYTLFGMASFNCPAPPVMDTTNQRNSKV